MKKLLSIFALLVLIVTGAWAYEGASGDVSFIKINSNGKANKMADGCYYYRPSSGYSWTNDKGVKTQSNASSAVFYLSGETNVTIDLGHYESKNAHTVTASVYSLTETQYQAFYAITSESAVTFTLPDTPTTTFTVDIAASSETFTGTKKLASGYYAIVVAGDKGNTYFSGMHFASAATYSVTYKANNGTADEDVVDAAASTFAACSGTWTVPEGKGFTGWNTAADGTGDAYAVGASVTSNTTVYAQWANIYTQFSMTNITGPTEQVASQDKASVTATFSTGGSAEVFNAHSSNPATMVLSKTIFLTSSGNSYCHVSFPSKLQAGDVIALGETTGNAYLATTSTKPNSNSKVTIPYTIPANSSLIGATDLYIFNNKDDGDAEKIASFSEFTITGAGKASDLAVTSATPININVGGESTIETSSSSTGAITFASSDANVATVSDEGVITAVNGGTATITISQAADDTYRAGATKVKVTVNETAIIKVKINGGTSATVTGSIGGTADVSVQSDKKFGSSSFAGFTLANENTFSEGDIINVNIIAASTGGNTKIIIYDSDKSTPLYDTGEAGKVGDNKFVLPAAVEGKKTLYICRTSANGWNAKVDYIAVYSPDATVTLNSKGYATYSKATDFEYFGADAYGMELTATSLSGTKVTASKIKAGEGILFKGEANAKVYILETAGAAALENNSLIGTTDINNEVISPLSYAYKYALSGDTFKKLTGALVANKAFFGTNEELSNSLDLVFDGATAINNVNANDNANSAAPVKVIKNGKLYIGNYNVAGARIK